MNWHTILRYLVQALVLILLLFTSCVLLAAPAPRPRPRPPMHLHPGKWLVLWCGTDYLVTLSSDRKYTCYCPRSGIIWHGGYWYDEHKRTLHVTDSDDGGQTWFVWTLTLSDDFHGTATYRGGDVPVQYRPDKTPL